MINKIYFTLLLKMYFSSAFEKYKIVVLFYSFPFTFWTLKLLTYSFLFLFIFTIFRNGFNEDFTILINFQFILVKKNN